MFPVVEQALEEHLNTNWNTTLYPIAWPNTEFNPMENKNTAVKKPWMKPNILWDDSANTALGAVARRYTGVLIIQLFVGQNLGSIEMRAMVTAAHDMFINKTIGGAIFRVPEIQAVDSANAGEQAGGWFQKNVSIGFYYDDLT